MANITEYDMSNPLDKRSDDIIMLTCGLNRIMRRSFTVVVKTVRAKTEFSAWFQSTASPKLTEAKGFFFTFTTLSRTICDFKT